MARCVKITTGTGAVAASLLAGGSASIFYGATAVNNETTTTIYLKIYWEGTGTSAPTGGGVQTATTLPAVATTIPQLTLAIPSTGLPLAAFVEPVNNGGRIWYWISSTLTDGTAQTALVTGGDLVMIVFD